MARAGPRRAAAAARADGRPVGGRAADRGIRGNGHMVMIEKNNLDIARLIDEWVVKNVK
jgi:hypothetical protein